MLAAAVSEHPGIVRLMAVWTCRACGVEYPESEHPPAACPICEDERQYVPPAGQAWVTP